MDNNMGALVSVWVIILAVGLIATLHSRKVKQENRRRNRYQPTGRRSRGRIGTAPKKAAKGFDPWSPGTYRNASSAQLYINGRPVYRYGSGENWTITRKPVTEEDFVDWIRINIKKQKFNAPEDRQKYYRDYVQWYYDGCDQSKNVYGGLKFTPAMLELSSGLDDEKKEKIGNIFTGLLRTDPRAYRFQQELYDNSIGVDSMFFAKVSLAASFQVEQDLMADYYHECEFEADKEVYEYFNNSEYLKKYPRLKEKAVKDALKWKIGRDTEDSE